MNPPRIAFIPDCYEEVNGVARTAREIEGFARRRGLPMLAIHAGARAASASEGSVERVALPRSPLSLKLDADLSFDLLFLRHRRRVVERLRAFAPDAIHITGPGDCGVLGAVAAHELKLPLIIGWHTNVHEFGARRLEGGLSWLPAGVRRAAGRAAERLFLECTLRYYRMGKMLLAPNPELIELLAARTGRPVRLMRRGVDTAGFHPSHRGLHGETVVLGYVGRLCPEKNVRLLAEVERYLQEMGAPPYKFVVVGQGSERAWLESHLERAEFTGPLRGEALARAYADMDVFLFPSHTDTYGNVVQEAMASGVPVVVTADGGPKFLVRSGVTGFIAAGDAAFPRCALALAADARLRFRMGGAAREHAAKQSWDHVCEAVYAAYSEAVSYRREPPTEGYNLANSTIVDGLSAGGARGAPGPGGRAGPHRRPAPERSPALPL
ncbi:MAG: glycosyltransferase [Bryobacterales bacterium]|nr:glycosyltransferase [Bryobacterales bacterium]